MLQYYVINYCYYIIKEYSAYWYVQKNNLGKDYNPAMTYTHPLPIHLREDVVRKMRRVISKIKGVMSTNTIGHHID